jgi:hypothetical protein
LQISTEGQGYSTLSFFFFFLWLQESDLAARVDINSPRGRVATRQGRHETGLPNEDVGMNRVWIDPE